MFSVQIVQMFSVQIVLMMEGKTPAAEGIFFGKICAPVILYSDQMV